MTSCPFSTDSPNKTDIAPEVCVDMEIEPNTSVGPMTAFKEAVIRAVSWFPVTEAGVGLFLIAMFYIAWRLTGRIFREKDKTTKIFRALVSVLVFFALALFRDSFAYFIRHGPLDLFKNQAEADARIQKNMQLWVAAEAYDAYWNSPPLDPRKLAGMSPEERGHVEAARITPAVMTESAMRGLVWMAVEHRHAGLLGRHAFPHAERGTKELNQLTVEQTQAMFDFIVLIDPRSELEARPYLRDALAFSTDEPLAVDQASSGGAGSDGTAAVPGGDRAGKAGAASYPCIQASRTTPTGRVFIVRMSATVTRVVRADSEAEALRIAQHH